MFKKLRLPGDADTHFILVFAILSTFFLWGQFLGVPDAQNYPSEELILLPTEPNKLTLKSPSGDLDRMVKELMPQGNRITGWVSAVKLFKLRETVFPQVLVGKDGWLYFTGENNLAYHENTSSYSEEDLETISQDTDSIRMWLDAQGTFFMVVIVPNKEQVYPEYLPNTVRQVKPESKFDQLSTLFAQHPTTPYLDLRSALLQAKSEGQVYYRTDTHWNSFGAYAGYRAILAALSEKMPGFMGSVSVPTPGPLHAYSGDLAKLSGTQGIFWEEVSVLVPSPVSERSTDDTTTIFTNEAAPQRRLVIFGDSTALAVIPFFTADFSYVRFDWLHGVDYRVMEETQPDVVIWMVVERYMDNLLFIQSPP